MTAPATHVVGAVLPGACGVRDYSRLLAAELAARGVEVHEHLVPDDGTSVRGTLASAADLLRYVLSVPRDDVVLWQYASYNYAAHGISMPGVLLGALARVRGVHTVTVLHELAATWDHRGAARALQALTQRLALEVVLLGSRTSVVTTEGRVGEVRRAGRRGAEMVPVFANITPADEPRPPLDRDVFTVGVFGWTGDLVDPDLLLAAVARLQEEGPNRLLLIGAPGPGTPGAARWTTGAETHGIGGTVEFSGIVDAAELSSRVSECDVFVQLDSRGASSRRGTVAAILAHARPLLTLRGEDTWPLLSRSGAVVEFPAEPERLADELRRLRRDPAARADLGRTARRFYLDVMSLGSVARRFEDLLSAPPRRRARNDGRPPRPVAEGDVVEGIRRS